ncbi:MAG TPA: hypothetical protein VLY04_08905 [Bryobacteraceae bacterium]|nr:hypothetical protein [Bryobacteraceae bacterium]
MPAAHAAERLAAVRSEVERACGLLVAPSHDSLNLCQIALQRAAVELADGRFDWQQARLDPELRSHLRGLHAGVARAAILLKNLAAFCHGWDRILGTMSAGYIPGGGSAPVVRQGTVCCRG